jgi:hypothetical protein
MHYFYEETKITLTQDAHCDVPLNADWQWEAHALDAEGNDYIVKWEQHEGFDGDDAGDACDWDYPVAITKL